MLVGMGRSPSGGHKGWGQRGQDRRDRDQPHMARGPQLEAGTRCPCPLGRCGPVGPRVDLEKVYTAPGWGGAGCSSVTCSRKPSGKGSRVRQVLPSGVRSLLWAARALLPGWGGLFSRLALHPWLPAQGHAGSSLSCSFAISVFNAYVCPSSGGRAESDMT